MPRHFSFLTQSCSPFKCCWLCFMLCSTFPPQIDLTYKLLSQKSAVLKVLPAQHWLNCTLFCTERWFSLGVYPSSQGVAGTEVASVYRRGREALILPPLPPRDQGVWGSTKESGSFLHVQSRVSRLLVSCTIIIVIMVFAYHIEICILFRCTVQVKQ